MTTILFYLQERRDGGRRSGLLIDGTTVMEHFEGDSEDPDPVLLWFVDLVCTGKSLPREANKAQHWLLANSRYLQGALNEAADILEVGVDKDVFPYRGQATSNPRGCKIEVRCSAARRLTGLEIAKHLKAVSDELETSVRSLTTEPQAA